MTGRTIAIGDIHGCSKALAALIEAIDPQPDDLIIPLGDYVDRGPDSRGVIDQMIELVERCQLIPLLRNHEVMFLNALESRDELRFWLSCGGDATLQSYGGDFSQIPDMHLAFIRGCHRHYQTQDHLFVHANFDPTLSLEEQPDRLLLWEHILMYEDGSHTVPGRHYTGKIGIVGHTPQQNGKILDLGDVVCIDTFCWGTGYLTAYAPETKTVWQTDKDGTLLVED